MARACAAKVRFPDADRQCPAYQPPAYDTAAASTEPAVPAALAPSSPTATDARVALPATGGGPALATAALALLVGLALRRARTRG
jgi:hypothetical protein